MAYTTVVAGTSITASWGNANVRDQVVTPFVDAAARTSAISAPVNGMVSVLTGTKSLEMYTGAAWTALTPANLVPTVYSPTVTWTNQTITTQSGLYLKTPGKLELWVSVNVSVTGAVGAVTITIPAGYTAATLAGSLAAYAGTWGNQPGNPTFLPVFAAAGATVSIASTATAAAPTTGTHGGYFNIPTTT